MCLLVASASGLTAPAGEAPSLGSAGTRVRGGQLEVSEWTLPGPSVGDVTEEGVVASCQPPLAWKEEGETSVPCDQPAVRGLTTGTACRACYQVCAWGHLSVSRSCGGSRPAPQPAHRVPPNHAGSLWS